MTLALNILIQREVTVTTVAPAPPTVYRFADNLDPTTGDAGRWQRQSDTELLLSTEDSDGANVPAMFAGLPITVTVAIGPAMADHELTEWLTLGDNPFTFQTEQDTRRATFEGVLSTDGGELSLSFPGVGSVTTTETVVQNLPSRRFDGAARNEVRASPGSFLSIDGSRYRVRFDPANPWVTGDTFTDETGSNRTVRGVAHLEQHAHIAGGMLELAVEGYT